MMEPIFLPLLARTAQQTEVMTVNTSFVDLEALTPVQGQMKVVHHGNYLQVEAIAETIVTLTCDRCLQQYNHRLTTQASELIWLREATATDTFEEAFSEVMEDADLVETLPPNGYFQPDDWLYQQLCLALPQRQLCDASCPGITAPVNPPEAAQPTMDQRWSALATLKHQLGNQGT
jgi:uncharacterized protein